MIYYPGTLYHEKVKPDAETIRLFATMVAAQVRINKMGIRVYLRAAVP